MKLIQRTGYYLAGFSIGIIILAFIWKGKRAEFSYLPEARVLKNISTKKLVYSQKVKEIIESKSIDSLTISDILKFGDIDFSKVDRSLDSCKTYIIESEVNDTEVSLRVQNCDSIATIQNISIK